VGSAGATAAAALLGAVLALGAASPPTAAHQGYHSYRSMSRHVREVATAHPGIVRIFSLGRSEEGRRILAAEVSDRPGEDEGEPEILLDGLHHAREVLSGEMAIAVLGLLASRYGTTGEVGRRVTRLVDTRRTWIVFMVNPDGVEFDRGGGPLDGGRHRGWRKNRQPTPGSSAVGTDLNRNWGYRWGCCGGSSGSPGSHDYRGPAAWSAPEVRAVRDFVESRVVDGRQRITAHISFHSAGEMVLWPYGHTRRDRPPDMTELDHRALVALGKDMATRSRYRPQQSSDLYPTDGDMIDWMYGRQRVFSFTFELYPRGGAPSARWYPPARVIPRETSRNHDAVLRLMDLADCPYRVLGQKARKAWCGPFFDDLEIERGWRVDPDGTDTATAGGWTRGVPKGSGPQVTRAADGQAALLTGRSARVDVDGGSTTIRSPLFELPADRLATLRLRAALTMDAGAQPGDGLHVHLVGAGGARLVTLTSVVPRAPTEAVRWQSLSLSIPAELAGTRLAVEVEARDAGADTLVEAAVDQVRVTLD
jgi:carboxypeptidase T